MGENWVSVAWQGSWRSLGDGQGCSLSPGYESRPRYGVRMRVRACVHEIQNLGQGEEKDPIGPSALEEILECHLLDDILSARTRRGQPSMSRVSAKMSRAKQVG